MTTELFECIGNSKRLAMATDTPARYIKQQKLGEGTYSRIFRGLDTDTNETVTLKLVRLDLEEDGIPPSALRETTALKNANHPNIIGLKGVVWDGPNLQLVLEFMDSDIKRWLNYGTRKCEAGLLRSYAFQLLCGCAVLHLHGIVHHNLQPSHVLINKHGLLKLCDFGSAILSEFPRSVPEQKLTLVSYRAPELLIEPPIADYPVDIWSCGCIIAELARGTPLFCGDCAVDQLMKICQTMGSPTRNEWPEFYKRTHPEMQFPNGPTPPLGDLVPTGDPALLNLLSKLLKVNPAKRPTAAEALRHPYFDELPAVLRAPCLPPEIAGIEGPRPD